jgi:purine nucleosidase
MAPLTIVLAEGQSTALLHAVKKVCRALDTNFQNAEFKINEQTGDFPLSHENIGLAVTHGGADFFTAFENLDRAGCWRIIAAVPSLAEEPWPADNPTVVGAFQDRCKLCKFDPATIVATLREAARDSTNPADALPASHGILRRFLAARKLSRELEVLLHGRSLDISNAILAPARMLCELNTGSTQANATSAWKDWLNASHKHREEISKRFRDLPNTLTSIRDGLMIEFRAAWLGISGWLFTDIPPEIKSSDSLEVTQLRRLSELLTEIRLLSGKTPDLTRNRKVEVQPIAREPSRIETKEPLRVLVVDDYADCWRPVLDIVAAQLAEDLKQPLCVEFSIDAKTVNTEGRAQRELWEVLPEYDLVLLDIYLPMENGETGLDLLDRLRQRLAWLPVIMWTTSLDSRLATKASLTNGYILKKTASCDDIVNIIHDWLSIGCGRRQFSLPNPFFDHLISTPDLRHCAVSFTDWCLKYLDSFHALDNNYFKYFNDHGGRHIVGLLNILEKLIRPLLFKEDIFSTDKGEMEKEILSIYLAVLCHELGMFPVGQIDSFAGYDQESLYRIRDLHAISGFLLLMRDKHPQQEDLENLLRDLKQKAGPLVHATMSLICAYHSRVLSLKESDFGRLIIPNQEKGRIVEMAGIGEPVAKCLTLAFQAFSGSPQVWKRARNLCCLFRFADALDVDETRVPADFILHHPGRSAQQDAEDLKRLVLKSVTIDRGDVSFCFKTNRPAELNSTEKSQGLPDFLTSLDSKSDATLPLMFHALRCAFPVTEFADADKGDSCVAPRIRRILDAWLLTFFRGGLNAEEEDAKIVAALSVICDIREEYAAIEKSDLRQVIRLESITWLNHGRIKLFRDDPEIEHPAGDYEFKFILPTSFLAGDIFDLIRDRKTIGEFIVENCRAKRISDLYYDDPVDSWLLRQTTAPPKMCYRQRTVNRITSFEIKRTIATEQDYPRYACERHAEVSAINTAQPLAIVHNYRITLELHHAKKPMWKAWLHLDEYSVEPAADIHQNRLFLEDAYPRHLGKRTADLLREIEVVGNNPELIMDLADMFVSSFNLVQVQSAKIQRLLPGILREGQRQKVWLDTDTGVDDAMGLLLALRSPERCEVVAVSAVGGNVSVKKVAINNAKIIQYAGVHPSPPVLTGPALTGTVGDASNVHGAEGIGEIDRFLTDFTPPETVAFAPAFKSLIDGLPAKEVVFVATGPLSNVAHLVEVCPESVRRLKQLVIMGGAFNEPGNREALPEFNVFTDPESARRVLDFCRQNDIKHTFVPLDVTHRVVLKSDRVQELKRKGFKSADFIASLTEHYMSFYDRNQAMAGCPLHDPMAVGFALWPELFITDNFHVEIAPSNCGPFSGATSADLRPTRLFRDRSKEVTGIILRVDRERFLEKIEEKLLRR